MGALLPRRQHNSSIFYIGVQRITCPNIEFAAKRAWKNNLSLGGKLGLMVRRSYPSRACPCNRDHIDVLGIAVYWKRWAS